jgi:hypothetical protein
LWYTPFICFHYSYLVLILLFVGMTVWATGVGPTPLTTKLAASIPEQTHNKALVSDEYLRVKGIPNKNISTHSLPTLFLLSSLSFSSLLYSSSRCLFSTSLLDVSSRRLSSMSLLAASLLLSRSYCLVPTVSFLLSRSYCLVPTVSFPLSRSRCLVLAVLFPLFRSLLVLCSIPSLFLH